MFSVTNPTQIKNNPSNNSTAKHHWSFSKAARFKDPNPKYFLSYSIAAKMWAINLNLQFRQGGPQLGMEIDLRILKAEEIP
mgnify:CR=1 FL=1